jgi:hypothetical protein
MRLSSLPVKRVFAFMAPQIKRQLDPFKEFATEILERKSRNSKEDRTFTTKATKSTK